MEGVESPPPSATTREKGPVLIGLSVAQAQAYLQLNFTLVPKSTSYDHAMTSQ